jgi:hypothetical protein
MALAEPYLLQNRHLYYDNFFSSVPLSKDLLRNKTYSCGTVRINRKGLPPRMRKKVPKMAHGTSLKFQEIVPGANGNAPTKANLMALVWQDKKQVTVLSTNCGPADGVAQRKGPNGRGTVEIARPSIIELYNLYMGGVDLADQYRAYYLVGREGKKFWRYLIWYLVNTSIVNAWLLYRNTLVRPLSKEDSKLEITCHLKFRLEVIRSLLSNFTARRRKRSYAAAFVPVQTVDALPGIINSKIFKTSVAEKWPWKINIFERFKYQNEPRALLFKGDLPIFLRQLFELIPY